MDYVVAFSIAKWNKVSWIFSPTQVCEMSYLRWLLYSNKLLATLSSALTSLFTS